MTNTSQAPRSLPVGSVLGDTTRRRATTFPIRHPSNQTDVHILHIVEEDVEILDGCHTIGCGMTSSLMRKCQHCQVISLSFVPENASNNALVSHLTTELQDCYQFQTFWIRWWCPSPSPPVHDPARISVQDWMCTWTHVRLAMNNIATGTVFLQVGIWVLCSCLSWDRIPVCYLVCVWKVSSVEEVHAVLVSKLHCNTLRTCDWITNAETWAFLIVVLYFFAKFHFVEIWSLCRNMEPMSLLRSSRLEDTCTGKNTPLRQVYKLHVSCLPPVGCPQTSADVRCVTGASVSSTCTMKSVGMFLQN